MKKSFCFILCLILGVSLISCSSSEKVESNKTEITNNTKDSPKEDLSESENDTSTDNTDTKNTTSKLISLSTYTADDQSLKIQPLSTIQVEENLSLQDKLTKLANELSSKGFKGLPIKVIKIETINGFKKATINLEDISNDTTTTWSRSYFQGTTMGFITTKKLEETFKQSSYSGEWITSIEFLYNNEKILFQHVPSLENVMKLR